MQPPLTFLKSLPGSLQCIKVRCQRDVGVSRGNGSRSHRPLLPEDLVTNHNHTGANPAHPSHHCSRDDLDKHFIPINRVLDRYTPTAEEQNLLWKQGVKPSRSFNRYKSRTTAFAPRLHDELEHRQTPDSPKIVSTVPPTISINPLGDISRLD